MGVGIVHVERKPITTRQALHNPSFPSKNTCTLHVHSRDLKIYFLEKLKLPDDLFDLMRETSSTDIVSERTKDIHMGDVQRTNSVNETYLCRSMKLKFHSVRLNF